MLKSWVHVKELSADSPSILFKISNHYLHFGREEFCLVTGFRCGELSEYVSDKIGFVDRLFWDKEKKQRKHVKVKEFGQIINNDKQWCALDDEDAIRST
nr:phospholipase-like protein [Tanacetum cinerariifolium]